MYIDSRAESTAVEMMVKKSINVTISGWRSTERNVSMTWSVFDLEILCLLSRSSRMPTTSIAVVDGHCPNVGHSLEMALHTLDDLHRKHTVGLFRSSRRVCILYHQPKRAKSKWWVKAKTCFEKILGRLDRIWNIDIQEMMK